MFEPGSFGDGSRNDEIIESPVKPFQLALTISVCFFAASAAYIFLSSRFAALIAASIPQLASIEIVKGVIYVSVATLLIFWLTYGLLTRIRAQHGKLLNFGNQLISAERRAAAVVISHAVAHDISNALMSIEYLSDELVECSQAADRETIGKLKQSQNTLRNLVNRLGRSSGQYSAGKKEYLDIASAVREAGNFAKKHRSIALCDIDVQAPERLMFMGNTLLIYQMMINLLLNAADATSRKGRIRVDVIDQEDFVSVQVHDNGIGIPERDRGKVMEPFFTTNPDGSGLGLLSVKACADAHEGRVVIRDSDLGGVCFEIRLKKSPPVIDDADVAS